MIQGVMDSWIGRIMILEPVRASVSKISQYASLPLWWHRASGGNLLHLKSMGNLWLLWVAQKLQEAWEEVAKAFTVKKSEGEKGKHQLY